MEDAKEREFLLSVFLMEAWDTLAVVEQSLAALASGSDADTETLRVVTHRLRGAAALNGFPRVSALAILMESAVDRAATAPLTDRQRAVEELGTLVTTLREALETIGATGMEGAAVLDAALKGVEVPAEAAVQPAEPLMQLDRFVLDNPDVLEYFIPEATEHLELMAQSLLALERHGTSDAEVATLFRAVHTLKGAAYTVGCHTIGALAHRIEDLLGEIRERRRTITPLTLEAVYAALDALRLMVRSAQGVPAGRSEAFIRATRLLEEQAQAAPAPLPLEDVVPAEAVATSEVAALPTPDGAPESEAGEPASDTARPMVMATRATGQPPAARPSIRVNLDRLDALMNLAGELVIARSRLERHLVQLDRLGTTLGFTESRMRQTIGSFEAKYANPQLPGAGDGARGPGESAREAGGPAPVPLEAVFAELEFDRYDDFNLLARRVGEIAADVAEVQGQLAQMIRAVREDASRMQHLSGELRGQITRARMVPIGRLFARFARQAREAARAVGKTVSLEVSGEAVELDNAVIEQIADPLLHLVQNAIVHGIEPEGEREACGKTPQGSLRVSAVQKGGAIVVEVADDGRGIDLDAVKATALRTGVVTPDGLAGLSDLDILDFIFRPGFSTAPTVTVTAGRGVGLDVVRTNVARLGGEIAVETAPGAGTRFILRLPLTVAVSDALMVRVGTELLAIPVPAVRGMVRVRPEEIAATDGGESVVVTDQPLDLLRLDRVLGLAGSRPSGPLPVVALRTARKAVAVAVDELLGKEEIVIKSLGAFLDGVGPFAGATVTGEGRVILLLDPTRLLDTVRAARPVPGPVADDSRQVTSPGPRARRTVLLVDDSVSVRKFVGQMLERAGFQVITANDGLEALDRLNADPVVDVVVTDLEMPRLNGYELIRDLKRRPAMRAVPVVILTTRAGDKHVALARQLGIEHYVTKPVDEQTFVQLVDSLAAPEPAVAV